MPSATFSLDGHDAPVSEDLLNLQSGDTERVLWYVDGLEANDTVTSVKLYAKVDPSDTDVAANTIVVTGTVTVSDRDANARDVEFLFSAVNTALLLRGRVYRIEVLLTRDAQAYIQTIAKGFIGASLPGSTGTAPSDEATLRVQGDATVLAAAEAYTDAQVLGDIVTADITDLTTAATGITKLGTVATGTWTATAIADTYLATISTAGKVANTATTATASNTINTIVLRDASGNFAAQVVTAASFLGPVTGNLTGNGAGTWTGPVIGNVTGNLTGNVTGNASTATTATSATTATTATTAGALTVARTFQLTGAVTASASSDLSGTLTLATTLADSVVTNAKVSPTAAIAYSKLDLVNQILNADIASGASIAYAKLNLTSSILNADIGAAAGIVDTKLATIATALKVSNSATTATASNTASAIVARDASGNFTATIITAALTGNVTGNLTGNVTGNLTGAVTGNASTATALQTARTINGQAFDGTANITITAVAAAGTLTGTTLASNVVSSSLTSVGVLASPHMTGAVVDSGGLTITLGGLTATGNSTITGTLGGVTTLTATTVTATNLGGTLSTAAQPNITSTGVLASVHMTSPVVDSGGIAVTGNSTVTGTLGVSSDFAINTNKLTVAAASGNTTIAGTLALTGAATFAQGVQVTGSGVGVVPGAFYKGSATGLTLIGVTGSGDDLSIYNPAGTLPIIHTPTGTLHVLFGGAVDVNGAPATAAAGRISIGGSTRTTIGANGGATALTALPLGYLDINVAGTIAQIPYYNRGA